MADEGPGGAFVRVDDIEDVANGLVELARSLERAADELRAVLARVGSPNQAGLSQSALPVPVPVSAGTGLTAQVTALASERQGASFGPEHTLDGVERRCGVDRRIGERRSNPQPDGLAARIFGAIERRVGSDRRSGVERRLGRLLLGVPAQ